jgi:outer membrane lipoprotein carrier protein
VRGISLIIFIILFLFDLCHISDVLGITGQEVLEVIQNQYTNTYDLEANFSQEYIGKVMRQPQKGEGKVYFKKKGMLRWDYQVPKQKLISDGQTLWFYQVEENQVVISDVSKMIKEFGFLTGEGDLRRDFKLIDIKEYSSKKEENFILELVPKETHPALTKIVLTVDKRTYFVIQTDIFDGLGNVTRTRFSEIRTNVKLPNSLFQFVIPPGVEVLRVQGTQNPSTGEKNQPKIKE